MSFFWIYARMSAALKRSCNQDESHTDYERLVAYLSKLNETCDDRPRTDVKKTLHEDDVT